MATGANKPGAFHLGHGWYAARGSDASVTLWCGEGHEITLTPDAWASLVAGVSASGDQGPAHTAALRAHVGEGVAQ